MPKDIEDAFATTGKSLFPLNLQEVKSEFSCPDKANPCKHICAIYFLMGDQFKEDPFILFQLRGKDRNTLFSSLVEKRLTISQERNQATNESEKTSCIRNNIMYLVSKMCDSFSVLHYYYVLLFTMNTNKVIMNH